MARAAILLDGRDSVAVAVDGMGAGETAALGGAAQGSCPPALSDIPPGHKIALCDIALGAAVVKYGHPIGVATRAIKAGDWVHSHNLGSGLSPASACPAGGDGAWSGRAALEATLAEPGSGLPREFFGYRRPDGRVGTRNEVWVVPTVGCVNGSAEAVARIARGEFGLEALALTHPYGCSQLGGDLEATRSILARLATHPNAGAAIVLSLGCENNRLAEFRDALGDFDRGRLRFIALQEVGDEMEEARRLLGGLAPLMAADRREPCPLASLRLGVKCGGSDGFSGISANPLVGKVTDLVVAAGGGVLMSEVPEMFGAEDLLYARAADGETLEAACGMVEGFKSYFTAHGQAVHENPSPGNRDGGITTLEEKSLGCVRKAGSAPVSGVLPYGGSTGKPGLRLVDGPGNDLVSSTALAAAGATLVLFTTGRGTPYGTAVPTLKISSNSGLAARKPGWIDFDAGKVLDGASYDSLAADLLRAIVETAGGRPTKAELGGHRGIAIFKQGVTL